ncbi:hypothetical protein A9Q78_08695 [Methylophaga sp. 41_12_T18]|nr:hypothetical protein A9Q78_08695 [Methylophaga sp. 41_12_T18]
MDSELTGYTMCQKALVLHDHLQTHSIIEEFLNVCTDAVIQYELNLAGAIQQLISHQFDYLICCDTSPEVTLDKLEQLKSAHGIPLQTRIFAFSYDLDREHKKQALALGIIDFHDLNEVDNYFNLFQPVNNAASGSLLLIEYDEQHAAFLTTLFEQSGHIVSHFSDIKLVHKAVKSIHYDLLITDVFSVMSYVGKNQLFSSVPTIVILDQNHASMANDLLKLGVADAICKPVSEDNFLLRIDRILTTKQNHRDELNHKTKHLLELSVKDALTGAYNRRYLEDMIGQRVSFLKRHSEPFSILILDIDDFKKINDTQGHQAGDKLLIRLVNLINLFIRNIDCCCRYGGEEFVIVLSGCSLDAAESKAEQIRQELEVAGVPVSIGVAVFDDSKQNLLIEEHINLADLALYQAKKMGKNQVVVYSLD